MKKNKSQKSQKKVSLKDLKARKEIKGGTGTSTRTQDT